MSLTLRKHILIIDDGADIQGLLRTVLESKGHIVDCSSNGAEALGLLNSLHDLPDVILLDMRMPVMDGFSFLQQQRSTPRLKDIPIVAMSGDDGDSKSKRAKIDVKEILRKPLSMSSVLAAIKRSTFHH